MADFGGEHPVGELGLPEEAMQPHVGGGDFHSNSVDLTAAKHGQGLEECAALRAN